VVEAGAVAAEARVVAMAAVVLRQRRVVAAWRAAEVVAVEAMQLRRRDRQRLPRGLVRLLQRPGDQQRAAARLRGRSLNLNPNRGLNRTIVRALPLLPIVAARPRTATSLPVAGAARSHTRARPRPSIRARVEATIRAAQVIAAM
jgi:hypothetical protein